LGFYDNYRARVQSTLTDSEYVNEDNRNLIIENFFVQPNYYSITKNYDAVTHYDVLIAEENKKKDAVGYKILISYPYTTTQFSIGDYINWESKVWLLTTLDSQYDYSIGGKIVETNIDLNWLDDNSTLKSYRAYANNRISDAGFNENKNLFALNGDIIIRVQSNVDTISLKENKRFIINGNAYRITNINNFVDGLLEFYMESADVSEYDDIINNIANNTDNVYTLEINQDSFNNIIGYSSTLSATVKLNDDVVSKSVIWSSSAPTKVSITSAGVITCLALGSAVITCKMADNVLITDTITITVVASTTPIEEIRILPSITMITQGDTVNFSVYKYLNNVQQVKTFAVTASGVPNSYYNLINVDANHFSIQNLQRYITNDLHVLCTCDDGTTASFNITLLGLW